SGVFEGRTLGTPILLMVDNEDARVSAYEPLKDVYRPSHADFTYDAKYGFRNWQGGGRASARETVGRVAAGAIAEKILRLAERTEIVAYVRRIAHLEAKIANEEGAEGLDPLTLTRAQVDATPVRCPDLAVAEKMIKRIEAARRDGDSVGGVIEVIVRRVPVGLGEPVFDRMEADLAKAMLSLAATKRFGTGTGFAGRRLTGSRANDAYIK